MSNENKRNNVKQEQELNLDNDDEMKFITPQLSKAYSINYLSDPNETAMQTLTVLTSKDLPRFAIMDVIASITGYRAARTSINQELLKRTSLSRRGKRGRDDLVDVNREKTDDKGLLDSFKDKIKSFYEA